MKGYIFVYMMTVLGIFASPFMPFIGICVYVLFGVLVPNALWYYSLDETFLNTGIGFSEVVAYPLIIGWALNHFGNLNIGKAMLPFAFLCIYTFWVFLSSMATGWTPMGQVQNLMNIRLILAMLIALSLCDTTKRLRMFIWVIVFANGFVAFELNMSYLQGFNRLQQTGYAGMDNNFFAVSMVVGSVLAFFTGIAEKNICLKGLAFLAAMLQAHAIMFSMSRGGMLGLLIAFIFTFLVIPKSMTNLTIFLLALVVGISMFGETPRKRFVTAFANMEDLDGSAQTRLKSWTNCAIVMREKPVFGVGVTKWASYTQSRFGIFLEAHSTWFQAAVDSGIPALLFLLMFFFVSAIRMLPIIFHRIKVPDPILYHYARMVFVAVIAYGISAQFVSLYAMESVFYTITIGLIILKIIHLQALEEKEQERIRMLEMQERYGYSM